MGPSCRWRWGALVLFGSAALTGCHGAVYTPVLGVGPLRANDPTLFDDAMSAVREAGHPPVRSDPEHGVFSVRAMSDPQRRTLFLVQCSRDGFVTVTPTGGDVVREGDRFLVSRAVRAEWTELVMAIERSVPETR
jgi:hypothetical protein